MIGRNMQLWRTEVLCFLPGAMDVGFGPGGQESPTGACEASCILGGGDSGSNSGAWGKCAPGMS